MIVIYLDWVLGDHVTVYALIKREVIVLHKPFTDLAPGCRDLGRGQAPEILDLAGGRGVQCSCQGDAGLLLVLRRSIRPGARDVFVTHQDRAVYQAFDERRSQKHAGKTGTARLSEQG